MVSSHLHCYDVCLILSQLLSSSSTLLWILHTVFIVLSWLFVLSSHTCTVLLKQYADSLGVFYIAPMPDVPGTSQSTGVPALIILLILILMTMFMVLSSWRGHCESSPSSFDECRLSTRWPPTLKPSQTTWLVSPPVGCYHPHPPSPFSSITQPESWYSFYRPTEGGKGYYVATLMQLLLLLRCIHQ